jgi:hypothetical protein
MLNITNLLATQFRIRWHVQNIALPRLINGFKQLAMKVSLKTQIIVKTGNTNG